MNLTHLKYFVVAAENKSLSKAAKQLFTTQPALSRAIQKLECEMGEKLLVRKRDGVELTTAGKLLYSRAVNLLKVEKQIENDVRMVREDGSRSIVVCAESHQLTIQFMKAVKRVQQRNEYLRVHFALYDTKPIRELLTAGVIDFGLILGTCEDTNFQTIRVKESTELCALMRNGHPLTEKALITAADLTQYPAYVPFQWMVDCHFLDGFGVRWEKLRIKGTFNLITALYYLLSDKDEIGLYVGKSDPAAIPEGFTMRALTAVRDTVSSIVWSRERPLSSDMKEVLAEYRDICESQGRALSWPDLLDETGKNE